jgi:hypothetical protein
MKRIFLLSPAHCEGKRARMVLSERAAFAVAAALRSRDGAAIGEVFSFMSGLYFRGKVAYSRAFARPPGGLDGALVITSSRGLRPVEERITVACLREFAGVPIDLAERRYRQPLVRDAERLAAAVGDDCEVVLLGSIATAKYAGILCEIFGARLRFPAAFVGRGDMSRGGLMLRCAAEGRELDYVGFDGALRHGARPPKLQPLRRAEVKPA